MPIYRFNSMEQRINLVKAAIKCLKTGTINIGAVNTEEPATNDTEYKATERTNGVESTRPMTEEEIVAFKATMSEFDKVMAGFSKAFSSVTFGKKDK